MPHLEFNALTLLLLQMLVIVLLSRVLALVTRRLGQPQVIAEVLAGIVLGPSLLGLFFPALMTGLFPDSSLPALKLLSQFGLIFFMFLVGLEFDPALLRGRAKATLAISHGSIVVPFILGAGFGAALHSRLSSPEVPQLTFVLFCGIALSITAFPVLARILTERNLMQTRVGAIAIASAAVDDVTAWCLLAFVVAVARAQGLSSALWTCGLALVFVALMLFVVRPFTRRLPRGEGELPAGTLVTCLVLLLASAGASELIGIHALFGAFSFGAVLPKEGDFAKRLGKRLEVIATVVLLPLFFAFSGLRTQLGLLGSVNDWLLTVGLIALATLGKYGAATVTARVTGLSWKEANAVGVLMNTRGLMELIVLNIGLDLGVISPTLFTMMVVMALVTTVATTPWLWALGVGRDTPASS
ncbi:MAG: hypothetical protein DI536_28215 [Archangium gephyra]|uniref:Cation/H+ exchanger transmembrane domain-containing protein n=1 Tax=Archangium gephyra TaxID=48 RepID=A0A2W5UEL3_9BACT|nr:MAG: hypothetical protein DI536_28215 [Archangium gephyra]